MTGTTLVNKCKKSDDTKMLESPAGGDSAGVGGVEGGQCKEERAWW